MNKEKYLTTGLVLTGALLTGCSTEPETPSQGVVTSMVDSTHDIYESVYECYPAIDMKGNLTTSCGFRTRYDRTVPSVIVNIQSCMPSKTGDQLITSDYAKQYATYPSDYPLSNSEYLEISDEKSTKKISCKSSFEVNAEYGHSLSIGQFVLTGNLRINHIS
jgi:hypothetical protein